MSITGSLALPRWFGIEAESPDLRPQAEPGNEKKGYKNLQNLLDVLLQYAKLDILNHTG